MEQMATLSKSKTFFPVSLCHKEKYFQFQLCFFIWQDDLHFKRWSKILWLFPVRNYNLAIYPMILSFLLRVLFRDKSKLSPFFLLGMHNLLLYPVILSFVLLLFCLSCFIASVDWVSVIHF